jgi:hypothetical protein
MPRGRKEGSVSGKRPIFWVCISNDADLIVDKIYSSESDIVDFSEEKASEHFYKKFGKKPTTVVGPCYDVKSLNKANSSTKTVKEKNININNSNPTISSALGLGHYNGWSGTVFSIKDKPDEVLFIALDRLDSNHNKILPPATPVKKQLINFV